MHGLDFEISLHRNQLYKTVDVRINDVMFAYIKPQEDGYYVYDPRGGGKVTNTAYSSCSRAVLEAVKQYMRDHQAELDAVLDF